MLIVFGFRVCGLVLEAQQGFRVSGFQVCGLGFTVFGLGFRFKDLGFRVQGSGFRIRGLGFRVLYSGVLGV